MHGFSFSTDVKVRFAETDAQGIAHNASYLVWYEVARVEYLRDDPIERLTTEQVRRAMNASSKSPRAVSSPSRMARAMAVAD